MFRITVITLSSLCLIFLGVIAKSNPQPHQAQLLVKAELPTIEQQEEFQAVPHTRDYYVPKLTQQDIQQKPATGSAGECRYGKSTITGWCNQPPRTTYSYSYQWYYTPPRPACNPLSPRCNY